MRQTPTRSVFRLITLPHVKETVRSRAMRAFRNRVSFFSTLRTIKVMSSHAGRRGLEGARRSRRPMNRARRSDWQAIRWEKCKLRHQWSGTVEADPLAPWNMHHILKSEHWLSHKSLMLYRVSNTHNCMTIPTYCDTKYLHLMLDEIGLLSISDQRKVGESLKLRPNLHDIPPDVLDLERQIRQ
jgi:hypothetical protein